MQIDLIATTTFGLEAVAKREIQKLGYNILSVEDGRITYRADERGIVKSNLWLRTPDRIYMKVLDFKALEFEELFQNVKGYAWEELIPIDGEFTVVGSSVKSKLHSVPACQSIVKKAIVERLKDFYCVDHFKEDGAKFKVRFNILKDRVIVMVDTSGEALHKRGYRSATVPAPLKETLAAALIDLSFWNKDRVLEVPCCGSGTLAIEAAMVGMNIAPGLNRSFASQEWEYIPSEMWKEEKKNAYAQIDNDVKLSIRATDILQEAVDATIENAINAGVDENIVVKREDIKDFVPKCENGIMILNPPYGKRIGDEEELKKIYTAIYKLTNDRDDWSVYAITSDEEFEDRACGRKSDRRRKLFHGNIKVCYYQYHGKRR